MTKHKVGSVAELFSKPKDPTTDGGKKLQSLFQEYYNKEHKPKFQSPKKETSEMNSKTEVRQTENQKMSKQNKKRKFSAIDDLELNNEHDSSKKVKGTPMQKDISLKEDGNKKRDKFNIQDFPRKKNKKDKVKTYNTSLFTESEVNDSFENDLEFPTVPKVKNASKSNKQAGFIKKSKHTGLDVQNDSFSDELHKKTSNNNLSDSEDNSIRNEINNFMKKNSKITKKKKNSNDNFKCNSQQKVFNQNDQETAEISNVELDILGGTPSGYSISENKHELLNSPKNKEVPDFIRKPKKKKKFANNSSGKNDDKKSEEISNKAFNNNDTLFRSEEEETSEGPKELKKKTFEQTAPDFIKLSSPKPDDEEVLSRTLFVGNLPVNTTRKALMNLFSSFGEIENIRYHGIETDKAKIFSKNPPKLLSTNYAADSVPGFIVFKERQSAVNALSLSGSVFKDHHITVDFAVPSGTKKLYDEKRSIFIGNLPFNVKDESIWNAFSECGRIEAVRVVRDHQTGIGKGFGYILFSTYQAKENALALEDLQIEGRSIRIKAVSSNKEAQKKFDLSSSKRDTFKSRAIRCKKNNKTPNSRKSIKKLVKREKNQHKKKKIASIMQKSMK